MGSAVSGAISGIANIPSQLIQGNIGGAISGVTSGLTGGVGADIGGLVSSLVPNVPIADQSQLQNQINQNQGLASQYNNQEQGLQAQAYGNLNQANMGVVQGQGAVNQAQNVNTGAGSNVNNAIGLTAQTAQGGGPAQQAASAQLQAGTDQAIRSQQAMANSGNLSQMIGGQKTAMDNAAQLQQQNANQAATLQAGMAANAQQNYTGAAAQQAGQAAQNAGLQQNQTAQQSALYNSTQGAANNYAGQTNAAQNNALTGQTNALGIQQQALGQTAQYRAQALGGLLNAGGGIAGAAISSDENLKKDIKKKPDIDGFLDAIDPVSFEYKESDGKMGRTQGEHLGVIAQQVEKAPGGKSMIVETPKGKGIDLASAVGTLLAAAAESHNRVQELEDLFKSKMKKKSAK